MEDNLDSGLTQHLLGTRSSVQPVPASEALIDAKPGPQIDIGRLLRKYGLLAVVLTLVGLAAGLIVIAFLPPVYKARTLIEVQPLNSGVLKLSAIESGGAEVDLQTEAQILVSATFLSHAIDLLALENFYSVPVQSGIAQKVRHLLGLGALDDVPTYILREGLDTAPVPKSLAMAVQTLSAQTIPHTHLIELTCDSTNPEAASKFLNSVADEYRQQNQGNRLQIVQSTNQWLQQQLDETKAKMFEAQQRLDDFVRNSGSMFVSQEKESTLAETQLRELQDRLSVADADLIAKQIRYDSIKNASPESLAETLDDGTISGYRAHLAELRQQESVLGLKLLPAAPKMQALQAEIHETQSSFQKAVASAVARITNDYKIAQNNRDALKQAYAQQAARISGQAGKESQYNALKRESEMARQSYNTLLLQNSQAGIAGSVPINNVRVVDPSLPPKKPYKPKAVVVIGGAGFAGLALCFGIAFLREKMDRSVRTPHHARQLFNLPQLGVIPSVVSSPKPRLIPPSLRTGDDVQKQEGDLTPSALLDATSPTSNPFLMESFRITLAALIREFPGASPPQVILVTSANPGEGKTTIASNLAVALAETGRNVLLIDGDFRRPRMHKMFGLNNTNGLSDIIDDKIPIRSYPPKAFALSTSTPHLYVLPNGQLTRSITNALYSPRLREFAERARQDFDSILIDAPPLLHLADARVLSQLTDGVVLVLRSGLTGRDSVASALEQLRADGTTVLGTVLNDWKPSKSEIKHSYYYMTSDKHNQT